MEAHLVSRLFNIIRAYLNHSPCHLTATEEEKAPFLYNVAEVWTSNSLSLPSGILNPQKGWLPGGSYGEKLSTLAQH